MLNRLGPVTLHRTVPLPENLQRESKLTVTDTQSEMSGEGKSPSAGSPPFWTVFTYSTRSGLLSVGCLDTRREPEPHPGSQDSCRFSGSPSSDPQSLKLRGQPVSWQGHQVNIGTTEQTLNFLKAGLLSGFSNSQRIEKWLPDGNIKGGSARTTFSMSFQG